MPIISPTENGSASPLLLKVPKNKKIEKTPLTSLTLEISQSNHDLESNNSNSCMEFSDIPEDRRKLENMLKAGRLTRHDGERLKQEINSASEVKKNTENGFTVALACFGTMGLAGVASIWYKYGWTNSEAYPNQPGSSTAFSQPDSSTTSNQPDSSTAFSQPDSSTTSNQPDSSTTFSQPDSSTAFSQPDSSTAFSQPDSSTTSNQPFSRHVETSGVYDDSFGNHGLHHDGDRNGVRHGRRHLTNPTTISATNPTKEIAHNSSNNAKVSKLHKRLDHKLRKSGFLPPGRASKTKRCSALAKYVYNPLNGLFYPSQLKTIARIILSDMNFYGGDRNEPLSTEQAEQVVRQFFVKEILGMTIEEYIAHKMITEPKAEPYTIGDLESLLTLPFPDENIIELSKIPGDQRAAFDLLWHSSLEKIMPIITVNSYHPNFSSIQLDSIEFANYYTGVRFLESISIKEITKDDAIKMGNNIWKLAYSNGIDEYPIEFFSAPAMFAILEPISPPNSADSDNRIHTIMQYIEFRKHLASLKQNISDASNEYTTALKLWQSKGELAETEINLCGKNLKRSHNIYSRYSRPLTEKERQQVAKENAKKAYLNGDSKPCDSSPDDLEVTYAQQTADVADKYSVLDQIYITYSWGEISDEERSFIESPGAVYNLVEPRALQESVPSMYPNYRNRDKELQEALKGTDLLQVQVGNEMRLYAMRVSDSTNIPYSIHRLDDTAHVVSDWIGTLSEKKITAYSAPKEWKVKDFTLINPKRVDNSNNGIGSLIAALTDKHRNRVYAGLYKSGHDLSTQQKAVEIIKDFIPLYRCIENPAENAASCVLDGIGLMLFVTELGNIGYNFAKIGFLASLKATSGAAIQKNIPKIIQAAIESGAIKKIPMSIEIGKSFLRFLDPGFEGFFKVTRLGLGKLSKYIDKTFDNKKIGAAISLGLDNGNAHQFVSPVTLTFQDSAFNAKVVGKLENGENVYALFNPLTEEGFGKKFIFDKQKGFIYDFSKEINLNNIDNQVKGIQNWDRFSYKQGLKIQVIPHQSGFYTSFNDAGEITGKLFLLRREGAIPVTELYKNKYYMIDDGSNNVIIMKSPETGEFEFIESIPRENPKINKYLEPFCLPVSRSKRQVNGAASCSNFQFVNNEQVLEVPNVPYPGREDIKYNIKYIGLSGTDQETSIKEMDGINETAFIEVTPPNLVQQPVDATVYERRFMDDQVEIREEDRRFTDTSDIGIDSLPNRLTKNEKIAIRRWTHVSDSFLNSRFSDGMIDFDRAGFIGSGYDINKYLREGRVGSEDERNFVRIFDSALDKLPSQKGQFIRIVKYDNFHTPWDNDIKLGDIVSNNNEYLSVFSNTDYLSPLDCVDTDNGAALIYLFEDTKTSKPLFKGTAGLSEEDENIFQRGSSFQVTKIAIAEALDAPRVDEYLRKRIVVVLKEVARPADGKVKNIYTGEVSNLLNSHATVQSQHIEHIRHRLDPYHNPVSTKIENPQDAVNRLEQFYDDTYLANSFFGPNGNLPVLISLYNSNEIYKEMHFSEFFTFYDYLKTSHLNMYDELLNPTGNLELKRKSDYLELSLRHLSLIQSDDRSLMQGVPLFRGEINDFAYVSSIQETDIIPVTLFLSTTTEREHANRFIAPQPEILDEGKVNVIYKITEALPYSGALLSQIRNGGENMYLFLPNTQFQVTWIEYNQAEKLFEIDLRQIPESYEEFNSRLEDLVKQMD